MSSFNFSAFIYLYKWFLVIAIDPYCLITFLPHDSGITFYTKCGASNKTDPLKLGKAVLQPLAKSIDLTGSPPIRTKQGRRPCSTKKPRSRSAIDHLN